MQTGHQNDCWWLSRQIEITDTIPHGGGKFLVDDTDQGLARLQRADDFLPQRFVFDARDEISYDGQCHVGLKQSHAHFAQHVGHIALSDAGLTADLFDEAGEFVGKG